MEIVFFDIETTIPATDIIEFGAIVLDKVGLYEIESYSTLLFSDKITERSIDCNGITTAMVNDSPIFNDVAGNIYDILHDRKWAGHNIINFDIPRILENFNRIGRKPPENTGIIDTYPLLRKTFGKRAGNMKMATLGNYFGLGQERHRAIEDCKMTIEVLKNCSMTMFLEENAGYDSFAKPVEQAVYSNAIIQKLNEAMEKEKAIWISYDGGSNSLIPRKIKPVEWVHEPWMIKAYCYQSQTNKNFTQRKIAEIRSKEWMVKRPQR